jgi:arylsulfatase A-like enzyme
VPCLIWWPGTIAPGRVALDLVSELDLFSTCLELAGAKVPDDRPIDGVSFVPVLRGTGPSPRTHVYHYLAAVLAAVRRGPWKLHLKTINPGSSRDKAQAQNPPLLFHLMIDPSERIDVAGEHSDVIEQMKKDIDTHRQGMAPGPAQK